MVCKGTVVRDKRKGVVGFKAGAILGLATPKTHVCGESDYKALFTTEFFNSGAYVLAGKFSFSWLAVWFVVVR